MPEITGEQIESIRLDLARVQRLVEDELLAHRATSARLRRVQAERDRYRAALEEIASESCTYAACGVTEFNRTDSCPRAKGDAEHCDDPNCSICRRDDSDGDKMFDPDCSGEVCTARAALAPQEASS